MEITKSGVTPLPPQNFETENRTLQWNSPTKDVVEGKETLKRAPLHQGQPVESSSEMERRASVERKGESTPSMETKNPDDPGRVVDIYA